jgi:diguanylate cyclase (GGDEF)-like protein
MRGIHNYYTKLFLVILITVIISSCLISGISIVRYVNNNQSLTEQSLISNAEQKVKIYEVNINSLHRLSESIANDVEVKNYFTKLKAGEDDSAYYQILKADVEGEMSNYPGLLENAFFVYNGLVYIDGVNGTSIDYSIEDQGSEWYINVLKSKKHYLGKLIKSPVSGLPVMVSGYPVLDDNNQILAVFGLAINLDGFSNTIISNSSTSKENTIIIDEDGAVVAANDIDLINNYNIGTELPLLYQYIEDHKEGIVYYKRDGVNYIAAVKASELGVIIIQSLPVNVYRNPIIVSAIISIIVLIVILGFVVVITNFVAKNITKPIHILVDEFKDMSEGNYDNEIPDYLKRRKDEFAVLGTAVADMKNQTSQLIMKLNLANEETEASLEEVLATEEELRKQNELLILSEDQLKKSNEYNKAILNVLPDVIYIINRDGTITDCQESLKNLPYMPRELFLNKNIRDVVREDVVNIIDHKIQAALATDVVQSFEYEFVQDEELEIFEFCIIKCFEDGVLAIARNVTSQRTYQKRIEYLSYHDQLTGLLNRRFFEEELKRLDDNKNFPLCIIMSDVNGLKLVNDSFGHKAGDMMLMKFANVIKRLYPYEDRIFRIGGDEFVILVPNMNRDDADVIVKNIKADCDKEMVNAINLSVSFGWEAKCDSSEDINDVLKSAEDRMYKKKLFDGPSMRGKTIGVIINTLHEKNKREEQHSHRVAELCEKIAIALKMPEHEIKEIRNAGLLHDIGKIAIQDSLLDKPGKLTPEEYEEVKRHPEIGYRILCSANEMTDIAEYILFHHERWDGRGYPRGLKEDAIPLQSRIIAIADTFDAMTSVRSYRMPVSEEEAAKEIYDNAGIQFDPELARLYVYDVLGYSFSA